MAKKRLLLANDDMVRDISYAERFIELFKRRSIEAVVVESVKKALEAIKKDKFDLIVTDLALKEGNTAGLDLVREIRKFDKEIKIFVSTGYGDYYKEDALRAGVSGYFDKPYDMNKLFFEPLGLAGLPAVDAEKTETPVKVGVPAQTSKALPAKDSLRRYLHEISNRHNDSITIASILEGTLLDYLDGLKNLKEEEDPQLRAIFDRMELIIDAAIADLKDVVSSDKKADQLLEKVSATLYKQLDPDKITIEG